MGITCSGVAGSERSRFVKGTREPDRCGIVVWCDVRETPRVRDKYDSFNCGDVLTAFVMILLTYLVRDGFEAG